MIWKLWQDIGYVPGDEVEMAAIHDDFGDYSEPPSTEFTPTKSLSNPDRYNGVSIRQFPKDTDTGEIIELLIQSGLPETLKESVVVRANGLVSVNDLDNKICLELIDNIHGNKFFGRKLFCNGVIPLTPEKKDETPSVPVPACPSSDSPVLSSSVTSQPAVSSLASVTIVPASGTISQEGAPVTMVQPGFSALLNDNQCNLSDTELVRRHSLSLRSPPRGSLADEILGSAKVRDSPVLERSRIVLAEMKDLQEQLSDFVSCKESESSTEEDTEEREAFKNVEDKKRGFKKKRKASSTPPKEFFRKKQYLEAANITER